VKLPTNKLTNKQTDRQTDKRQLLHNLVGRSKNYKVTSAR